MKSQRTWRFSLKQPDFCGLITIYVKNRTQQGFCIRMHTFLFQSFTIKNLNHLTQIHNRNSSCHRTHKCQIMSDKHAAHVAFFHKSDQKLGNLILNRHIQSACSFIADQNFRRNRDSSCNCHSLELTAGKFMRISHDKFFRESNDFQKFLCFIQSLFFTDMVIIPSRFRNIGADQHSR